MEGFVEKILGNSLIPDLRKVVASYLHSYDYLCELAEFDAYLSKILGHPQNLFEDTIKQLVHKKSALTNFLMGMIVNDDIRYIEVIERVLEEHVEEGFLGSLIDMIVLHNMYGSLNFLKKLPKWDTLTSGFVRYTNLTTKRMLDELTIFFNEEIDQELYVSVGNIKEYNPSYEFSYLNDLCGYVSYQNMKEILPYISPDKDQIGFMSLLPTDPRTCRLIYEKYQPEITENLIVGYGIVSDFLEYLITEKGMSFSKVYLTTPPSEYLIKIFEKNRTKIFFWDGEITSLEVLQNWLSFEKKDILQNKHTLNYQITEARERFYYLLC